MTVETNTAELLRPRSLAEYVATIPEETRRRLVEAELLSPAAHVAKQAPAAGMLDGGARAPIPRLLRPIDLAQETAPAIRQAEPWMFSIWFPAAARGLASRASFDLAMIRLLSAIHEGRVYSGLTVESFYESGPDGDGALRAAAIRADLRHPQAWRRAVWGSEFGVFFCKEATQ